MTTQTVPSVPAAAVMRERQWTAERVIRAYRDGGLAMLALARLGHLPPRYSELVQAREQVVTTRCASRVCGGRCSRCVRADAVTRNRLRYGQDDYPGADALAVRAGAA